MSIKKLYKRFQFEGMITENNGSIQGGNLITWASKKQSGEFVELRRPSNVEACSMDVRAFMCNPMRQLLLSKNCILCLLRNQGYSAIDRL